MKRRTFLLATASIALTNKAMSSERNQFDFAEVKLEKLEKASGGRLGVCLLDTKDRAQLCYRAEERFPLCSTFKVIVAAAILSRSTQTKGLLQQRIHYTPNDIVSNSPISEKHINDGMTIAELCAAAIQYSDNTSANLLMKILDGPAGVTAYARSIGNQEFRLDRWETELNTCIPGDLRDTATPTAMAHSLKSLSLNNALPATQRQQLNEWLCGNTTGAARIRSAIPINWQVGDKTGSGNYGTTNDIAVLWPPEREPIILAIYYTQEKSDAKVQNEVVAAAARIAVESFV